MQLLDKEYYLSSILDFMRGYYRSPWDTAVYRGFRVLMIIKNILRHFFVSRFLLTKNSSKKILFYPRAQKTSLSPRACEPARACITLGTRRSGFCVTSS